MATHLIAFLLSLCALSAVLAASEPLFLTQYLPNDAATARSLSKVTLGGIESYSGYFTVNSTTDSNMFFWFFPCECENAQDKPVLLWLNGGPGYTSLDGLFNENGPFRVEADATTLTGKPYSWTKQFNVVYIDNPVGVGFSFTGSDSGFVTNEAEVGANLYEALYQFFEVFEDYRSNDFYITGESYAGKYIPATGYTIHIKNPSAKKRINLKGISIGDGMMDPLTQTQGLGTLAFWAGIADYNEMVKIQEYEAQIEVHIKQKEFYKAFLVFDEMINGDFYPYPPYFRNITGTADYFNIRSPIYPPNPYDKFLQKQENKDALHVGTYGFQPYNSSVEKFLVNDWMVSVTDYLVPLLENYKVLIYNGQNDIILSAPVCENFLRQLNWSGRAAYVKAQKKIWKVDTKDVEVAGFARNVNKFTQVVVRDAGHLVPQDQPRRAYDMMRRFVNDVEF